MLEKKIGFAHRHYIRVFIDKVIAELSMNANRESLRVVQER